MWTSTNIQTHKRTFDFSSSEQGRPTLTSLTIADDEFINIIDSVEEHVKGDQTFQVIVCEECGIQSCSTGNWVALRRLGDYFFFIPAFEDINEVDGEQFKPPELIHRKGAFWLPMTEYHRFRSLVPAFPDQQQINELSLFELVSLYKWETPYKMFGQPPRWKPLRTELILAVSHLDKSTVTGTISQKLVDLQKADRFVITPATEQDTIISVYLEGQTTAEWRALTITDKDSHLLLGGHFKIITG